MGDIDTFHFCFDFSINQFLQYMFDFQCFIFIHFKSNLFISKVRHDISVRWEEKYVCVKLIVSLRELEGERVVV